MTIVISGGHLTPALAFIDYIKTNHPATKLVFFGREYSQDTTQQKARERSEMKSRTIPFRSLYVPRFSGSRPWQLPLKGLAYLGSIIKAWWWLLTARPSIFVSFGGYIAVPVAVACKLLMIPIVTHEQTITGGQANQFIAKLATKVAVSFPETVSFFPRHKTIVTGNPLRAQLLSQDPLRPTWITQQPKKPVVFVTGGNQGSYVINMTIMQALSQLTNKYTLIHACGKKSKNSNYKLELEKTAQKLTAHQRASYFVREWVTEQELAWIYRWCQCTVSRAGANTIHELALLKVPSVLIPLPQSKNDEQLKNAQFLASTGGAVILAQKDINATTLLKAVNNCVKFYKANQKKLTKLTLEPDGAQRLYALVTQVAPSS